MEVTAKDKGIELGLQIATGAIEKLDIDKIWDDNFASFDPATTTVVDLMKSFVGKLVIKIIGVENANKTIAEMDESDQAGIEILEYMRDNLGIEIDLEEDPAESNEPPKLELVE